MGYGRNAVGYEKNAMTFLKNAVGYGKNAMTFLKNAAGYGKKSMGYGRNVLPYAGYALPYRRHCGFSGGNLLRFLSRLLRNSKILCKFAVVIIKDVKNKQIILTNRW